MTNIKTKDAKPLDKFEPCPFCGHYGQILTTVKTSTHYALSCQNCGATGPYSTKREEAGWNKRILPKQSEKDTAMAMTLAEIRQIIGVDKKTAIDQLPDLIRAAIKQEWLPIEEDNPPPHKETLLLFHVDFMGREIYETAPFSTGERLPNGFSNYSQNAYATHYMRLPASPKKRTNNEQH